MSDHVPAKLRPLLMVTDGLEKAATVLARDMRKRLKSPPRSRGATLRPSIDTPLWNALVAAVRPLLNKRGEKVLLARELGLDPSRVTEFFVAQRAMPDAERTLELLIWLSRRRRGARP